jgi:flagellar hook-basal body complex protein FliE
MVDRVDVNSVLMQMRQVKTQLRSQQEAAAAMLNNSAVKPAGTAALPQASAFRNELDNRIRETVGVAESPRTSSSGTDANPFAGDPTVPDFQTMFQNAIGSVNQNQKTAADLASRFEQGDSTIDLPQVMIAMQKSSVSFQAMTQVRNKLVEAYKDIMNMPL